MIGERFNMEDVFFRDLTVCVLDTLEGQVNWINRFSSGDVYVRVPFYYSLTGDERFLLDTFQDDVVSENRFVELNTDIIPRGHITMTGFNINSDEFSNPNVWLRMVVENEVEIRKVLAKVRAVPITVSYDLEILLSSEIDTFKCSQAIMDTLWLYKFMYFEHNFMNIDAVILMPDGNSIEMAREKNMSSDNNIKMKVSFEVQTYYPAFRKDRVNATGYPRSYGDGMTDLNGHTIAGGFSEGFGGGSGGSGGSPGNTPYDYIGGQDPTINTGTTPYGATGNFYSDQSSVGGSDPQGTYAGDPDYYQVSPKRTRWFNNILRARQKSNTPINNPNSQDPNNGNDGNVSN
jgi:hypothetical protein